MVKFYAFALNMNVCFLNLTEIVKNPSVFISKIGQNFA